MEIDCFTAELSEFTKKSLGIVENIANQSYKENLLELNGCFLDLLEFLNDDSNRNIIKKYEQHIDEENLTPLGFLCASVLDIFKGVDSLIHGRFFYLRPKAESENELNIQTPFDFGLCRQLIDSMNQNHYSGLLSSFNVLKHLDGHNKTLIVLGPNGSGKTSLANHLKNADSHVKVIPASKPIRTKDGYNQEFKTSLENYNDNLYKSFNPNSDLMQSLITGMCNEHDDIARAYMDTGTKEDKTVYEKVKEIFDDFFDVSLDNSEFSSKELYAKKDGIPAFRFNNMSDGERAAFFYIATVIAAPASSFIIVDEPENHLNPAIYNKIWDRLIESRKDCQFIFITHNIEFVCARSNYEIVRIKRFDYPDKFDFEFMGDSIENINSENIIEVVGSRKPILFCEGDKAGLDYIIYESLFGNDYTIIPTGNCSSVERSVEACNLHNSIYSLQSAIGIIDSDLKCDEEIERLKIKKINVLKCNEIEMLLIDSEVIKAVLARTFKPEEIINEYKDSFFKKLDERKTYITKRLTKTRIDEKLKHTIIDDKDNNTKDQFISQFNSVISNLDIDKLWDDCDRKIATIIDTKDYDEALRYCCLEHGEIINGLCNKYVKNYKDIALGLMRTDRNLIEYIKNKYFKEINCRY